MIELESKKKFIEIETSVNLVKNRRKNDKNRMKYRSNSHNQENGRMTRKKLTKK